MNSQHYMHSAYGWIYIGAYVEKPFFCKVGISKISHDARFKQTTTSPDYVPYRAYRILMEDLHKLEGHLHNHINREYRRAYHLLNGAPSECFYCSPSQAAAIIEERLKNCISPPMDENGYDLSEIIHIPNYLHLQWPGAWGPDGRYFLSQFMNEDGSPTTVNMKIGWDGIPFN
ncbi:hypothetical protein [Pantoea eucalypti]|jgi:hypothetical protein|uniref:hypothetical protein n=1 Tax=Pantoea eucalypti TaxID=470933 RepID=UPI00301D0E63